MVVLFFPSLCFYRQTHGEMGQLGNTFEDVHCRNAFSLEQLKSNYKMADAWRYLRI